MIYYEFLKLDHFLKFINHSRFILIPEKGLLRQHDVMLTSAGQQTGTGQTDQWVPHVSS